MYTGSTTQNAPTSENPARCAPSMRRYSPPIRSTLGSSSKSVVDSDVIRTTNASTTAPAVVFPNCLKSQTAAAGKRGQSGGLSPAPHTMRGVAARNPVVPVVVLGGFCVFVLRGMTPKIDHREPSQWHPEQVLARGGASSLGRALGRAPLRAQNETTVALRHNLEAARAELAVSRRRGAPAAPAAGAPPAGGHRAGVRGAARARIGSRRARARARGARVAARRDGARARGGLRDRDAAGRCRGHRRGGRGRGRRPPRGAAADVLVPTHARAECERKFGLGLIDEYAARGEVGCDEPADGGGASAAEGPSRLRCFPYTHDHKKRRAGASCSARRPTSS